MKIASYGHGVASVLLCSAALLVGALPASAHEAHKHAARSASQPAADKFEIKFLKNMIDHHAMAVHMARACSTRAEHEELRQLCEQIKTAQQSEIASMQAWLQTWYGMSHHPHMKPKEMREMERLESLSGRAFEIAFLEMMVQHHRTAIREADQCLRRAEHAELRQLCQNIHTTQKAEVAQMQRWSCQWYGKCR